MESIFRVPWESLGLDDVRAFFADAGDEGVTWEAKGPNPEKPDEPLHPRHVQRSACGLANAIGGYFIAGATQDKQTKEWSLPGVVVKHDEPVTWIDDAVGSLRHRPRHRAKSWELRDDCVVTVVEVEPVPDPPCMTAGGEIYERVSGKTVRVTDPLVLARLYERGDNARRGARNAANARLDGIVSSGSMRPDEHLRVCLSLAALGYEADIGSRMFQETTAQEFAEIVKTTLHPDRYTDKSQVFPDLRQDALMYDTATGAADTPEKRRGPERIWRVWATWDGVVTVRCAANDGSMGVELFIEDLVRPMWRAAAPMVEKLGGFGGGYLVVEAAGGTQLAPSREGWDPAEIGGSKRMARSLTTLAPDEDMLDSIKRELMRSVGFRVWEPEPQPGDGVTD